MEPCSKCGADADPGVVLHGDQRACRACFDADPSVVNDSARVRA